MKQQRKLETTEFKLWENGEVVTRCFTDLDWWDAANMIRDWKEDKCFELYQTLEDAYEFIVSCAEQEQYKELLRANRKNIKEDYQDSYYLKCLKMYQKINFLADALKIRGYEPKEYFPSDGRDWQEDEEDYQ